MDDTKLPLLEHLTELRMRIGRALLAWLAGFVLMLPAAVGTLLFPRVAATRDTDNTAFIGDDIPDLQLMRRVGLSIAVADAHESVRDGSDWITSAAGGGGAVREVCDALLKARGKWDKLMEQF